MAAVPTGCSQIIAVDIHASRLRPGGRTGRHPSDQRQGTGCVAVIKQITGKGAHHAVETTGVSATFCRPYTRWKPLGTVAIVGFYRRYHP
ncbi:hypothetical protein MJ561_16330 [Klebsiella pneumoniae]|nr:hypothetical protein MJ561_16330 [Klebsiella pneumoniae]